MRGMLMNRSYVYSTTSMTYQLLPGSTDFPACNAQDGVDVTRSRISMTALQRTHSNQLYNPLYKVHFDFHKLLIICVIQIITAITSWYKNKTLTYLQQLVQNGWMNPGEHSLEMLAAWS